MKEAAAVGLPKGARAWSYSRLMDYEKCPQLYKFKVIDRLPEPGSPAMERGSDIHKKAETFLNSRKGKCPPELLRVQAQLKLLRRLEAVPEDQWTFTHNFLGTTSWFGKDAWLRVKIDAVADLPADDLEYVPELPDAIATSGAGVWIVDWKTGQYRPESSVDQLELYVMSSMILRPKSKFALASLAYTDVGKMVHSFVPRTPRAVESLKKKWTARALPMQRDTKFKATPSESACRWCFFSKKKGGPCRAG